MIFRIFDRLFRIVYGFLCVLTAITAMTGAEQLPLYGLIPLLVGGLALLATCLIKLNRLWLLVAGLLLIHVGTFANGLSVGVNWSHHAARVFITVVILVLQVVAKSEKERAAAAAQ